jgi:hypothetical protein
LGLGLGTAGSLIKQSQSRKMTILLALSIC